MTPDDFPLFYETVHGHEPFPWQARLLKDVAGKGWPAVLALPTASGKTSAIDVALFTLALQAEKPLAERTAPLRIFFVVDRRLVVDQAARHAHTLRSALEKPDRLAPKGVAVVKAVAERLRRFGGPGPLHVTALRGGMYRDDSWVRMPTQPTVCVSTVDQVGSRLLFRGYGVSESARPVHAALTGNDALYLLDEAHLSEPFLATLRAVGRYRLTPWAEQAMGGPFCVVEISATPQSPGDRFTLSPSDTSNQELRRRLEASKPASLVEPARFEQTAVELAGKALSGDVKIVGVVVNRVASAAEIFNRLPGEPFEDRVLLTGRIRPWDRDQLLARCLDRMKAGRTRSAEDRPLVVAATMTVEVGADLDFDHLITEAAPLAALRQRFGRLDRLGRFGKATGAILLRKSRGADPIYGDDLTAAWEWLGKQAGEAGVIDFGVSAFDRQTRDAASPPPASRPRHAPVLFPAHLDAWVQTSPAPEPSPDVAPFLHGAEALEAADVQVVWRADLQHGQEDEWLQVVAAAPPRSREALALSVAAVRAWLERGEPAEVADVEGTEVPVRNGGQGRPALRWLGPDNDDSRVVTPGEVRPGDTVVVPSTYGGADAFGWDPQSTEPVDDVGDLCVNDMADRAPDDGNRRLIRLRLHDGFEAGLQPAAEGTESASPASLARELRKVLVEGDDPREALEALLTVLIARPPSDPLTAAAVARMADAKPRAAIYPAGVILTARVRPGFHQAQGAAADTSAPASDVADDDTSSLPAGTLSGAQVDLASHQDGVARWTHAFAGGLGLDDRLRAVLDRAARLHDLGKADWRFQYLLYGDEPGEVLLAKSGREWTPTQHEQVRRRAGLPRGFRHEFVSVALLRAHVEHLMGDLTADERAQVVFLVGTHHGRGRPFPPVIEETTEPVRLQWEGHLLEASPDHRLWRLDSGWTDEFWALVRRHGYWGLAYLEALRLADTSRSVEEQQKGEKP